MAIQISQDDFDDLRRILTQYAEWQTVRNRTDFITDVLAGSPRRGDILGQLDLDGAPRGTAVRTIQFLMNFGQDEPGREALGVLINKLIANYGGGEEADFLRQLLRRYPFTTKPVAVQLVNEWRGNDSEQSVTEKIIGENTLRDVYILELLFNLSRAVARIQGPQGLGTGFLISRNLLMTNHHVIESVSAAQECSFQFNYQLDRTGRALPVHTIKAQNGGLFVTSPLAAYNAEQNYLDYTVLQLADVPDELPHLTLARSSITRNGRLTIIQHPGGDYKKISFQNNFVEYIDQNVIQYTTSTEPGSSGSPVLSDDFSVVAIHHSGGQLSEPATKRRYLRNEGVRMSAILDDLHRVPEIYRLLGS